MNPQFTGNILAQMLIVLQREENGFWTLMNNVYEQSFDIFYAQTAQWT